MVWCVALGWAGRRWKRLLVGRCSTGSLRLLEGGKGEGGRGNGGVITRKEWDALLALAFTGFGAGAGV